MNRHHHSGAPVCLGILLAFSAWSDPATGAEPTYDVVVYGGTSAGVVAAVQSARMGKTVVLVEPGTHLGGLTSGGLGWTDSGNKAVIGGLAREFYRSVKKHYDKPAAWVHETRDRYSRYRPKDDAMWTFEPHVAESIFERMVNEHKTPVVRQQRLDRKSGVKKEGRRIVSITMESGETYRGRMFIDATYEGDLLAAAGVSYTVGRESNKKYGETLNGVQKKQNFHNHRFLKPVDPYLVPGDRSSGLLSGVRADPPGAEGQGDRRIQAYCFRMCMSNVAKNRVPFPKPKGYDEKQHELLLRNFEAGDHRLPLKLDMMPNGKTDTNNNCAVSTDYIGMNYAYPEATYPERERIIKAHETYQKGLMWTLAHHPRVPEKIRQQMSRWGLAQDEFTDNGNWPHQIYVREARRMVSGYVMTEQDCRRVRVVEDSVGLGSYNMDSHNIQRYVTAEGHVQNEGDVQVSPGGPYVVSYRSIVPKHREAENLLAPVCLSASHIAYGSIRMEPVFMILGQSAATAAVLAIDGDLAVQNIPYGKLRKRLLADKQVLDLPKSAKPQRVVAADKLPGVVIDDTQAKFTGAWVRSRSVPLFVEYHYRHDNNAKEPEKTARFEAKLKPGRYEVRMAYTAHANRAMAVPITIHHASGTTLVKVDQRQKPKHDGLFTSLGEYRFDGKKPGTVVISNVGTKGYVVVDAVQFLPLKE